MRDGRDRYDKTISSRPCKRCTIILLLLVIPSVVVKYNKIISYNNIIYIPAREAHLSYIIFCIDE